MRVGQRRDYEKPELNHELEIHQHSPELEYGSTAD